MRRIKIVISPEYENNITVRKFAEKLPDIFGKEGIVLYSERNTIKSFILDESDEVLCNVVVKRYKWPNFIQQIVYSFFRPNKAKRAFYNAEKLRRNNVDTPREIAYIEQWEGGLFKYGFFLSGYNDAPCICKKLIEQEDFDRVMAKDFADFAIDLHKAGILDNDLNSTNVLYHPKGNHYRFSLIDINRMKFLSEGKSISRIDCLENLTRFTGRMDLFEYVVRCYAEKRNWDIETSVKEAIQIKEKHDRQWKRRKVFLRKLTLR
jgi:hypothetical protein